ncbi:DUF1240 domain-containing protein [Providencia burhodogranariea]|uniref:DUF1240 domain-containing protein n=1 Tax=Providencia burhodogranariea DSM 19968 TaxID=1141662 RepID=K8X5Q2_9GAMM|nr:hypothetical protein OOA_00505 [Providencia burhodogranariea DSM 19968]
MCSIIFNRAPKDNKIIIKYLTYLLFAGIISFLPISLIIKVIIGSDGYQTCDKISWMLPTTYVTDLSLCD